MARAMIVNMIKNLIFDFDGTIADTSGIILAIAKTLAEEFNLKVDPSSFDDFEQYKNMSIKEIQAKFNINFIIAPKIMRRGREEYSKEANDIKAFKEVKEVIYKLNSLGYKLGILSSSSVEDIEKVLEKEQINIFRYVYSSKKLFGKATVLRKIVKDQKLVKSETIYIGDEIRDIEAAKKAGLLSGGVTWGLNGIEILKKAGPDYIFENPEDIINNI